MKTGGRRVLLDTSILIDYPGEMVAEIADEVAVSAVTFGELHFGLTAVTDPLMQLRRRRRLQFVTERFAILDFDATTAEYYGTLATLVREHGRNPRSRRLDLQIAATAVQHGLVLLTRNCNDFSGLESVLRVVDLGP